jgi:methionine synthase II (cobalamin-independent)
VEVETEMAGPGDRILTTHAGSLPRPDEIADMIWAQLEGNEVAAGDLDAKVEAGVAEIVAKQREIGIDLVSDGELSKTGFSTYVNERFEGSTAAPSSRPTTWPSSPSSRCGFDTFIRFSLVDPGVAWLKLRSLVEGAEIASAEL